jgi:hypothetical protein
VPEDEPEIKEVKPEEIASAVKFIQELDPYHPVYINYTQMGPASRYAGLPGDIMSLDYYLTSSEGRTIKDTLQYVDIMQEVSRPMHVPVWNFIIGSNLDNHPREISAAEQVAQTYANIVKGVTGLQYFFGQVAGRKHWETFKALNHEIEELTQVILSGEEVAEIKSGNPNILVMTRKYDDSIYLFCVNIENRKSEASFDLAELKLPNNLKPGFFEGIFGVDGRISAEVTFEKRQVECSGQILKDTFLPFERHIYKFKGEE